jgi:hypothetical protein
VFAIFYKKAFGDAISIKLVSIIILSFVVLCVINALYFQSIYTYNSYTRSLEAIFIMAFAIAYFFRTLEKPDVSIKEKESILWINAALLIYFSGALVLFIVSNMVSKDVALGTKLWNINATLVLIMYILFATGLWKARK